MSSQFQDEENLDSSSPGSNKRSNSQNLDDLNVVLNAYASAVIIY